MSPNQRLTRRAVSIGVSVIILGALWSCDPCAGVVGCVTSPRVAVQGRLVDPIDGHAISGARISLVRTDATPHDSASTTTDDQGNYQVELTTGSGTFDVDVAPLGLAAYQVHGLTLSSSSRSGDGHVLGVWVTQPAFGTALELIYRSNGQPVQSGTVSFRRTGGVAISGGGLVGGVFTSAIDPSGRVAFLAGVAAAGTDDVIGDLIVTTPESFGASVIHDLHVKPSYEFRPRDVLRMAVGPEFGWVVSIYDRATVVGVPGTTVSFRRTGGVAVSPESFTGTTDGTGQIRLPLTVTQTGTVIGDLSIQPPAPFHAYVISAIQLSTADSTRHLPAFGVGPHLPWLGVVQCGGVPLKGASMSVVRVGGIDASPTSETVTSDESGNFSLIFKPADYGDLLVDIAFTPPAGSGCIGYVQHSLRLPTLDFDSGARFIAAWNLPSK